MASVPMGQPVGQPPSPSPRAPRQPASQHATARPPLPRAPPALGSGPPSHPPLLHLSCGLRPLLHCGWQQRLSCGLATAPAAAAACNAHMHGPLHSSATFRFGVRMLRLCGEGKGKGGLRRRYAGSKCWIIDAKPRMPQVLELTVWGCCGAASALCRRPPLGSQITTRTAVAAVVAAAAHLTVEAAACRRLHGGVRGAAGGARQCADVGGMVAAAVRARLPPGRS